MKDYTQNIINIRSDFPFFNTESGKKTIYMDSAATSLKPQVVIDKLVDYHTNYPANIHRAVYDISQKASDEYEKAREITAQFIGAETNEVIFTSGTTASINLFSRSFAETFLKEGDRIVLSEMEHHANLLPWQKIAKDFKCSLEFIPLTDTGELDLSNIKTLLQAPTKLVAITAISNTLGTTNPIKHITELCKKQGIFTFIDAAQSIAHIPYSLKDIDSNIDFMAFSGHKMYASTGIGVFYGRKEYLKKMTPFFLGGGIVYDVDFRSAIFGVTPSKFEAGTPPIAEALSLASAIKYIQSIGWETIQEIEHQHLLLGQKIFDNYKEYIRVFGNSPQKTPIFSFQINDVHPHDVGSFLNEYHIAARTGHQCTQPLWKRMSVSSITRVSPGIYNLPSEWEILSQALESLLEFFHVRKFS